MSRNSYVLDASSVLAYLHLEAGHEKVEAILDNFECHISALNVAEVLAKLLDRGLSLDDADQTVQDLGIHVSVFGEAEAKQTAKLRPATKAIGASLGDRACMALAVSLKARAATAERLWLSINISGLHVELTR